MWRLCISTCEHGEHRAPREPASRACGCAPRRRARDATDDAPFNAGNLQAAVRHNAAKEKEEDKTVEAKPADEGEQPVPKAEEEQAAAAKLNENPATPVPKHVLLANVKSESTLDSDGTDKHPIDVTGTVRGTSIARPIIFSPMGKLIG